MKKIAAALGLLALVLTSTAYGQTQNETVKNCRAHKIIGFESKPRGWRPANFNSSLTFTVKDNGWVMMSMNNGPESLFVDTASDGSFVQGKDLGFSKFIMKKKTGKFTATFLGGYVNDNHAQTPWMAVGKCI